MPWSAEQVLAGYFKLLGLSCCAQRRSSQQLLSAYLAIILGDMIVQVWRYFLSGWQMNDFQHQQRQQFKAYVKIIDAMNFAYLLTHMLMVLQALLWRNRERALVAQLPHIAAGSNTLINLQGQLMLETIFSGSALILAIVESAESRQLLPNLRYLYSTQAVRARFLQMTLLVVRLDTQLEALQQQLATGRRSSLELRVSFAHIVRLARQLSRLYGLSVLVLNILSIGDFIMVFYAYIVLSQLTELNISWLLVWQTIYVMLPTLIKIWTLCATCHNCAQRSKQLLAQISRPGKNLRTRLETHVSNIRQLKNEFAMQVMQNPLQFDICGIYNLNLQTLAGMFFFIVESLVIFLQFVELTKHQTN